MTNNDTRTETMPSDAELARMASFADVAAGHPTWSVAYAEDVPRLLAIIDTLRRERTAIEKVVEKLQYVEQLAGADRGCTRRPCPSQEELVFIERVARDALAEYNKCKESNSG